MEPQNQQAPSTPMTPMEMEPNNTILSANEIKLDSSSPIGVSGEIGDSLDPLISSNDVDLFAVELNAGDTLWANIDTETGVSSLNSVLSVFDINGNRLAQNDDNSWVEGGVTVGGVTVGGATKTENDSLQPFTAPENGIYYVGVSSSPNVGYDATVAGSGTGVSSGTYTLKLSIGDETITDNGVIDDGLTSASLPPLPPLDNSAVII